ncbi:hypothetical protein [Arthrobacter sulfonylureivorans]|uniref:Tail assembly chaperone n=1 Tax=Arthrobacter sulfonylureivorans TaxID=2486855 RepID=A0ABY3WAE7_9MICC|nr:hypothetical protein [Arthrobacter sulfonylureivorans]UNK47319.1 hypothetical protein MNQ99_08280 [Arthrobacter sulfonylureivorans]
MAETENTISLAGLLAEYDEAEHDHAAAERNSGMQHIHNHANGDIVWFPTWQKNRETTDWEIAINGFTAELSAAAARGADVSDEASGLLASRLQHLLEQAAEAADANAFIRENLARYLSETWALGDAYALKSGKDLPGAASPAGIFASFPYEVYERDGGSFASALWNDLVDARKNRIAAEEAERKALKPVSKKARKAAERKAAARKR